MMHKPRVFIPIHNQRMGGAHLPVERRLPGRVARGPRELEGKAELLVCLPEAAVRRVPRRQQRVGVRGAPRRAPESKAGHGVGTLWGRRSRWWWLGRGPLRPCHPPPRSRYGRRRLHQPLQRHRAAGHTGGRPPHPPGAACSPATRRLPHPRCCCWRRPSPLPHCQDRPGDPRAQGPV